jgi:hypothetical protein
MADFINNLTSISWWIGVVIVGILLNLAAMYLKSPIDKWLSSISTKYQTRSKAKKAEREVTIKNLVGNKHEQILFAFRAIFISVGAGFMTITGYGILIIYFAYMILHSPKGLAVFFVLSVPIAGLVILVGFISFSKAMDDWQILMEARNRESKVEGSN